MSDFGFFLIDKRPRVSILGVKYPPCGVAIRVMEALGEKLRRQRRRLGLTLDELAVRSTISKPYLSLIETGRVPNPPSDEKLQRLEQTLGVCLWRTRGAGAPAAHGRLTCARYCSGCFSSIRMALPHRSGGARRQ